MIELDGPIHEYKIFKDRRRTEILELLGINVIRFSNKAVEENLNVVLEKIVNNLN